MRKSNRALAAVAAAVLGVFVGGAALAADNPSPTPSKPMAPGEKKSTTEYGTATKPENIRQVEITVKKVDTEAHKVTFEAQVSPEARLLDNGRPIALDQLKEGDSVRASFDTSTGELIKVERLQKPRQ
ncbi:MAG TPA: hypothetical protein VGK67_38305 [Myxococcales bacterium]|jgi:Cu/Ag efflux protein CusF